MIKNLVFDLGNVLVEFQPTQYMKRIGFAPEETEKLVELIFKDPRWNEFDRGSFTIEEYVKTLAEENPEHAESIKRVFQEGWLSSLFLEKQESITFLKEASKKYKIYVLSNVSEIVLQYIKSLDFWSYVTSGTYSYLIKACKPEEKIYETFLKEHSLKPEECFFMDDKVENIQAAKRFKIDGMVFTDDVLPDLQKRFL